MKRSDFFANNVVRFFAILPGARSMESIVQRLAQKINMSRDEFVGEMRKRGCSEPTALKIWRGEHENFDDFKDNDINLSNLRKAAFVLRVATGTLLPK
jgi:hypothetical protein